MAKEKKVKNCRLGTVGGQAVLEGVMMKSKKIWAVACRMEDSSIKVTDGTCHTIRDKYKILRIPIVRGFVNMIESLIFSYKTLEISAESMGIEDAEPETKFEKWIDKHFGEHLLSVLMVISSVLGIALGFGLFFLLPIYCTKGIEWLTGRDLGWIKNLIEGVIKILIFIGYLVLVSLMKEIRRTFEYHGAEHKSIFCYEAGEELTVENVKKYKRFHPRCGTSFLFVILIISILINSLPFVTWDNALLRMLTKILILPLVIGIGFEFIMFAGKHDNAFTRILSAPGLWMQRITTREPDGSQIECAIAALKCALPEEFPGAKEEYDRMREEILKANQPEEKKTETEENAAPEEKPETEENVGESAQ